MRFAGLQSQLGDDESRVSDSAGGDGYLLTPLTDAGGESLARASQRSRAVVLYAGPATQAARFHRLHSEIQMVLHAHRQRSAGRCAVRFRAGMNALWLMGRRQAHLRKPRAICRRCSPATRCSAVSGAALHSRRSMLVRRQYLLDCLEPCAGRVRCHRSRLGADAPEVDAGGLAGTPCTCLREILRQGAVDRLHLHVFQRRERRPAAPASAAFLANPRGTLASRAEGAGMNAGGARPLVRRRRWPPTLRAR